MVQYFCIWHNSDKMVQYFCICHDSDKMVQCFCVWHNSDIVAVVVVHVVVVNVHMSVTWAYTSLQSPHGNTQAHK